MLSPLETAYLNSRIPFSRQRMLIVRLLAKATDHPTVTMLLARARQTDPYIGRTSVGRALALLVQAGLATCIEERGEQHRYEDGTVGDHGHLRDAETGKLINVSDKDLQAAFTEAARKLGYRLTGHRMTLTGTRLDSGADGGDERYTPRETATRRDTPNVAPRQTPRIP